MTPQKKHFFLNIIHATREVYSHLSSLCITLIFTVLLITAQILFINPDIYFTTHPSFPLMTSIFFGSFTILPSHSLALLFVVSLFAGIFLSFFIYHFKHTQKNLHTSAIGSGGMILGILAPSCTTCGIGLAALFGFTGIFTALPFQGVEIGVISLILLTIGISTLAARITHKTCTPPLPLRKRSSP